MLKGDKMKHDINNLKEKWGRLKWRAYHGEYDWAIPILMIIIGYVGWWLL